jgi:signal transduction histidine kinase
MRIGIKYLHSYRLSIQQRLTLLICTLLLSAIAIYGFANYYTLKKAILIIGKERLGSLTGQISTMLGNNSLTLAKIANKMAAETATIQCLRSNGGEYRNETLAALAKLRRDSTWVSIELLDKNLGTVLRSENSIRKVPLNLKEILKFTPVSADSTRVGKIYNVGGIMYYPVITAVSDNKKIIGYIVCWAFIKPDPKGLVALSRLVGTGAGFYIVNSDWSMWTDMIKPIASPSKMINHTGEPIEYTNKAETHMFASAQHVPYTDWIVVIEFSENNILTAMGSFVNWILLIGIILTAIGILAAWAMSRNMTRPLKKLTVAATTIANGKYDAPVLLDLQRSDELGELARAFDTMTGEVFNVWQKLDSKVKERTGQLELVNKELDAFSYSVSHDLRTPLRAVMGYANMLREDYGTGLDDEGNRIISVIIENAKMMGQLIDDLLSFSRIGKKELMLERVDMQSVAQRVVEELSQHDEGKDRKVTIGPLPPADAEPGMIRQVFVNLISNAIKYSSKKSNPLIEINAVDEATKTIYYVKDNGTGFDMAYAGKLFGVFQRLHSKEEFEGTGVGLALVKRIIEKHGGEVWAEATENIGAVFYFSLPKV